MAKKKNSKKLIGWDVFICIESEQDPVHLTKNKPYRVIEAQFDGQVIWFLIKSNTGEEIRVDSKYFRKRHRANRRRR